MVNGLYIDFTLKTQEFTMKIISNIGFLLLAIYLILVGISSLGVAIPGIILGILALVAGIFIIIGR